MSGFAWVARWTAKGSFPVVISLWAIANVALPVHFWLLKYNTLQSKGDVPFNEGLDPTTLQSKVLFKCFCVMLKVSCLLSYAMTALTMCRWLWTKVSMTSYRKFLPLDRFESIHRWSAIIGWFELCTVTLVYLINWKYLCDYYKAGNESWNFCADFYSEIMITGYLLTLFHTIIIFTSLRAVRRKRYELFYWTHHLCIGIFILSIVHPMDWRHRKGAKERMQTWPVMIGPVTLYLLDRLIILLSHRWTTCMECSLLTEPKTIFLKLHGPKGFLNQRPGMIAWLNVPPISWLNWHPFSCAHTDESGSVYLIIHCVLGGWTEKLFDCLVMATPHVPLSRKEGSINPTSFLRSFVTSGLGTMDAQVIGKPQRTLLTQGIHGAPKPPSPRFFESPLRSPSLRELYSPSTGTVYVRSTRKSRARRSEATQSVSPSPRSRGSPYAFFPYEEQVQPYIAYSPHLPHPSPLGSARRARSISPTSSGKASLSLHEHETRGLLIPTSSESTGVNLSAASQGLNVQTFATLVESSPRRSRGEPIYDKLESSETRSPVLARMSHESDTSRSGRPLSVSFSSPRRASTPALCDQGVQTSLRTSTPSVISRNETKLTDQSHKDQACEASATDISEFFSDESSIGKKERKLHPSSTAGGRALEPVEEEKHSSARLSSYEKTISGEALGRGLYMVRDLWHMFHDRKTTAARTHQALRDFVSNPNMWPLGSDLERQIWLDNLEYIPRLAKWGGSFGLSGPFHAGTTEASNFEHAIMVGAGGGIVPCLAHVKSFLDFRCPLKTTHQKRHSVAQLLQQATTNRTRRLSTTTSVKSFMTGQSAINYTVSEKLAMIIDNSPLWALFWYIYILLEFATSVGALALSVNGSMRPERWGNYLWPTFKSLHWAMTLLFLFHKTAVHVAFGLIPRRVRLSDTETRRSRKSMIQQGFDWALILLSFVFLVVNQIGRINWTLMDDTSADSIVYGYQLPGGLMSSLTWDYLCHITSVGGYFCQLKQIYTDELLIAEVCFVGIFLCSIFRMLRVWAQTPRLLSGGQSTGQVAQWEKDLGRPTASRLQTVDLVWIMRSPGTLLKMEKELESYIRRSMSHNNPLKITVYLTDPNLTEASLDQVFGGTLLRDGLRRGRPNLSNVFTDICKTHMSGIAKGEKVGIFVCGPYAVQAAAKSACDEVTSFVMDCVGNFGGSVTWLPEKFS